MKKRVVCAAIAATAVVVALGGATETHAASRDNQAAGTFFYSGGWVGQDHETTEEYRDAILSALGNLPADTPISCADDADYLTCDAPFSTFTGTLSLNGKLASLDKETYPTNISFLGGTTILDVSNNNIADFNTLVAQMPNLTELNFSGNKIFYWNLTDWDANAGQEVKQPTNNTLRILNLSHNGIESEEGGAAIKGLWNIDRFTALVKLDISGNPLLKSIEVLDDMTHLKELNLAGTGVTHLDQIINLKDYLDRLDLTGTFIDEVEYMPFVEAGVTVITPAGETLPKTSTGGGGYFRPQPETLDDDDTKFLENDQDGARVFTQESDGTIEFWIDKTHEEGLKIWTTDLTSGEVSYLLTKDQHYHTSSGSTIIRLLNDYLSSLAVGSHRLHVEYADGTIATGDFVVQAAVAGGSSGGDNGGLLAPETGMTDSRDGARPELTLTSVIIALGLAVAFGKKH